MVAENQGHNGADDPVARVAFIDITNRAAAKPALGSTGRVSGGQIAGVQRELRAVDADDWATSLLVPSHPPTVSEQLIMIHRLDITRCEAAQNKAANWDRL
jgi:hypothetical protein